MISTTVPSLLVRDAQELDITAICAIYNQGIEDRIATLDEDAKSEEEVRSWFREHDDRYRVLVAERNECVVGWASLNPYSHRCADRGVADLSVYVERDARGSAVGTALLQEIENRARRAAFHKIVLFALARNTPGRRLYQKMGFREVGVFRGQGRLDGRFVDVLAMEKIIKPFVLFVCKHNTGRSQMAEAFLRRFVGDAVEVMSAGTIAADRPDPGVVAVMAEVDIDISDARPKLIDPALVARANRVITMGCDVEGVARIDDDWGLPDPKGQPLERVRETRDLVRKKAGELARALLSGES
jgi:L-amino acid N-acyltransferase YncA/protein-tyrosine-phosphatase